MDINLAGHMDGFKAAEMIKVKHEVPIIFLTGYSDKNITKKIDSFEKSTFIKKSTTPERVHFEIEKIFNVN
jgi:DNA-binding LytR/AlgR family response regulator